MARPHTLPTVLALTLAACSYEWDKFEHHASDQAAGNAGASAAAAGSAGAGAAAGDGGAVGTGGAIGVAGKGGASGAGTAGKGGASGAGGAGASGAGGAAAGASGSGGAGASGSGGAGASGAGGAAAGASGSGGAAAGASGSGGAGASGSAGTGAAGSGGTGAAGSGGAVGGCEGVTVGAACYYLLPGAAVPFQQAFVACKQSKGNIASFPTKADQDQVATELALASVAPVWLGLQCNKPTPQACANSQSWVDDAGKQPPYDDWAAGEPMKQACSVMNDVMLPWHAAPCTDKARALCKR